MNMSKSLQGFAAWMGSWVAMCSIADYVIVFETISWAMAYGVLACTIANKAQEWIEGQNND